MQFRPYDPERDREAAHRIWREIGWIEPGKENLMDICLEACRTWVADLEGSAECIVLSARGDLRYLEGTLPFAGLAGVSTSRVARRQGLARRLTALTVAEDAADGVAVHGLGMFDQGFYNRLGYGTGPYEHWVRFDPSTLTVDVPFRVPRRLTATDAPAVHAARRRRYRVHGSVSLDHVGNTSHEMLGTDNGFGLGYFDADGHLTHHVWMGAKDVGHGPYTVYWMTYRTRDEFLELMALLRSLGDQVRLIEMEEPGDIQLQDLLSAPFRRRSISQGSRYEAGVRGSAYWQVRICDLAACLAPMCLAGEGVRFNLLLTDPIAEHLDADAPWRGIGGDYVVELGPSSGAEPGADRALPTLEATVNAFSRLWLGVRPATGLAITDALRGPQGLLERLDALVRLPRPHMGWEY